MKHVPLRDFQLKPSAYMKQLPIILTVYGKGVGIITPYEDVLTESANTNQRSVNRNSDVLTQSPNRVLTQSSTSHDKPLVAPRGMRLSGKMNSCPICYETVAVELAQQHYMKQHGDI